MKTDQDRIEIVLRDSSHPFRLHGPCVVKVEARPDSRVVAIGRDSVRVAFTRYQLLTFARAMGRAYPRLRLDLTTPDRDPNSNYVPGAPDGPFVVAYRSECIRIGIEIAERIAHPVVELTAKPQARVRRIGDVMNWMPSWTEFSVLHAEFGVAAAHAN